MHQERPQEITRLLRAWSEGCSEALEDLLPVVERELRRQARGFLRRERAGHSLVSMALVNEAFLRLLEGPVEISWSNRSQFFGIAGRIMRRVLIDHARKRLAAKRDGIEVPLEEGWVGSEPEGPDWAELLDIHDALDRLYDLDERQARVVELKFFAGLSHTDIAEVMEISTSTVKREWRAARAWLLAELGEKVPG